jgi:hypothetical protein
MKGGNGTMTDLVSFIVATLVTIPFIGYLIFFIICKQITKNHRRSVLMALDGSTFLLVGSVHYLIITIWQQSYLWLIFLIMLIIAIIFVLFYYKTKQEIVFIAIFKGYWRLNFLLFLTAYLVLVIYGLVQRVSLHLSAL